MLPPKLVATFFGRFDKSGSCWIYQGAHFRKGYGNVHVRAIGNIGAHILSYLIVNKEPLYPWECVLHHCDNPACGNPEHLFKGTKQENTRDAISKGRFVSNIECTRGKNLYGEKCPNAKLKVDDVVAIRKARTQGIGQKRLAKRFNVCYQTIQSIEHYRSWKSI
jgi:hypothetical protein